MKRMLAVAAVSGLFLTGATAPALAADDSAAHEQHMDQVGETRGWEEMGSNPSDMDGMMCSPPMHGAEHPGPGDPPSVTTVVGDQDDDDLSEC